MAEEKRLRRAQRQERERQDRERPALAGTMTAARQKMGLRVWSHMLRQWTLLGVRSGLQEWKLNYKLSFCTRDRDKAPFDPSGPLFEPIGSLGQAWVSADRMAESMELLKTRVLQLSYRSFGEASS